jgi:ADP-heptose:LPS heptosyltransferase
VERLLISMPWGIGDAIVVGLSAVDQIARNDPHGNVAIDLLCNPSQTELLEEDPRIHRIIEVDKKLFPTSEPGSWKRGIFLSPEAVKLAEFLRNQGYTAVLPFMFAPTFFYQLHLPVIFLNLREAWQVILRLRAFQDASKQTLIRRIINKHFGASTKGAEVDAPIPLYICPEHVQKARNEIRLIKQQVILPQEEKTLLMIAPDTSSKITRPPTSLLAEGVARALTSNQSLFVVILPSYTDQYASSNLLHALAPSFPGRIFLMPAEPKHSLLELAAFIDQSDIFVSGDTGVMHLAATTKKIKQVTNEDLSPRNAVKIITLFGGTNPALHGHSKHTIILGRGRKEQARFTPGLAKDVYDPKGQNLFDHIPSQELTDAILLS